MNARLAVLLAELRERFPGDFDPAEVARFLRARGVDRRVIGELVATLERERAGEVRLDRLPGPLFRVEGPHERGRFSPEAWGHLLGLLTTGQVTQADFEAAIDRLLSQVDGQVGVREVRALIEGIDPRDDGSTPLDAMTVH
ncbi:MAG: hypothetical protein MUF00_10450 [Gemmatimonadaceae bacterium]|jgi:Smg protein|nr:hypothetical protein [Gemmatimonadaceae bacterium]